MRPFPVVRVRLSEILEICMLCVQNNADNSFVVPVSRLCGLVGDCWCAYYRLFMVRDRPGGD